MGCAPAGVGESVVDALSSSLTGVEKEKVEALVDLIKTASAEHWCSIKSRKQDTLIPQEQSVLVSCRAAIGPVGKIPVLFKLDPDSSCPSGLEIPETQLTVAGASTCRVNIRVDNPSKHDVVLKGRTVLGRLQQVKSVTPLEGMLKETPVPTADGPSRVDTSGESGVVAIVVQSRGKKWKVLRSNNHHVVTFLVLTLRNFLKNRKPLLGKCLRRKQSHFHKQMMMLDEQRICKWTSPSLIQYQCRKDTFPFPDHFMLRSNSM